jgi:hypothetical protein
MRAGAGGGWGGALPAGGGPHAAFARETIAIAAWKLVARSIMAASFAQRADRERRPGCNQVRT